MGVYFRHRCPGLQAMDVYDRRCLVDVQALVSRLAPWMCTIGVVLSMYRLSCRDLFPETAESQTPDVRADMNACVSLVLSCLSRCTSSSWCETFPGGSDVFGNSRQTSNICLDMNGCVSLCCRVVVSLYNLVLRGLLWRRRVVLVMIPYCATACHVKHDTGHAT